MRDIVGDKFDSLHEVGMLEVANHSLKEPDMQVVEFTDNEDSDQRNGNDGMRVRYP